MRAENDVECVGVHQRHSDDANRDFERLPPNMVECVCVYVVERIVHTSAEGLRSRKPDLEAEGALVRSIGCVRVSLTGCLGSLKNKKKRSREFAH